MKTLLLLLSNKSAINSAKLLALQLSSIGIDTVVTATPNAIKESGFIRYGNGQETGRKELFNPPEFIRFTGNKNNFSRVMQENGVYSPTYHKETPDSFPVLIRETLFGMGAEGIIPCRNLEEFNQYWNNRFYWTPFARLEFELRVHVFNHQILKVFKKEDIPELINPEFPIRNNDSCHYKWKSTERYPKLQKLVDRLKEITPINNSMFYAMDVAWDANKKEYFLIELNSCPGLNQFTAKMYAEQIKSFLER